MIVKRASFVALAAMVSGAAITAAHADGSVSVLGRSVSAVCADNAASVIAGGAVPKFAIRGCTDALRDNSQPSAERAANYLNRGVLEQAVAQNDGALADFDTALRLDPNLPQAQIDRGVVFSAQHRPADAIAAFTQALELGTKETATVYFDRAVAHEDHGDLNEAYRDYRKAAELAPAWEKPKHELARFTVVRREAQG